jgi:cytochrome o ubiquinol oxidase subunit 1
VAHFHTVLIGGVLFGGMAGYNYWFPKAFGFSLDRRLGLWSFWCWIVGFYLAFVPLYVLGLLGMTRRLQHYDDLSWQPYLICAAFGAAIIFCGIVTQVAQLIVSIRTRASRRDTNGDPWDGRTLEWSTASPPPTYNYAVLPQVTGRDSFWAAKQERASDPLGAARHEPAADGAKEAPVEVPNNSPNGFVTAFFAVVMGFALIWHIWWMAILGSACAALTLLVFGWVPRAQRVL